MLKLYKIFAILLFLALVVTGCGGTNAFTVISASPGDTYYTSVNGTEVPCDGSPNGSGCSLPFYYTEQGVTYYCNGDPSTQAGTQIPCYPVTPTSDPCKSAFVYNGLVNDGESWKVVSRQQDQNNSISPAQVTFTSTASTTVTVTDKLGVTTTSIGSLGASVGVLKATITESVQTTIGIAVSVSVTTSINNSYNFSVPPGETAYANYGVKVQITSGHLYDKAGCEGKNSNWGTDITYVPIAEGWCVWTNKQPAYPSI